MTKLYPGGGDITPGGEAGCIEGYLDGQGRVIKGTLKPLEMWPYI